MTTTNPLDPNLSPTEVGQNFAIRAAAHSADDSVLRVAQRWHHGVSDLQVSRVFLALEYYRIRPYRNVAGRWYAPTGTSLAGLNANLSPVIGEMIRTGLVRHWIDREGDHLIPAPVHLRERVVLDQPAQVFQHSACLFVGEDLGPMRSRMVDRLDLVDCLACCETVASGSSRKL